MKLLNNIVQSFEPVTADESVQGIFCQPAEVYTSLCAGAATVCMASSFVSSRCSFSIRCSSLDVSWLITFFRSRMASVCSVVNLASPCDISCTSQGSTKGFQESLYMYVTESSPKTAQRVTLGQYCPLQKPEPEKICVTPLNSHFPSLFRQRRLTYLMC